MSDPEEGSIGEKKLWAFGRLSVAQSDRNNIKVKRCCEITRQENIQEVGRCWLCAIEEISQDRLEC